MRERGTKERLRGLVRVIRARLGERHQPKDGLSCSKAPTGPAWHRLYTIHKGPTTGSRNPGRDLWVIGKGKKKRWEKLGTPDLVTVG